MSRRGRGGLRGDQAVPVIELVINGKHVELEQPTPLLSYLEKLGVNPRAVAVEHNGEIIERSTFASTTLGEGDRVEIVRMVGGGLSSPFMGRWPAKPAGGADNS
jgi:thiamine biosynthesis protein ThiS